MIEKMVVSNKTNNLTTPYPREGLVALQLRKENAYICLGTSSNTRTNRAQPLKTYEPRTDTIVTNNGFSDDANRLASFAHRERDFSDRQKVRQPIPIDQSTPPLYRPSPYTPSLYPYQAAAEMKGMNIERLVQERNYANKRSMQYSNNIISATQPSTLTEVRNSTGPYPVSAQLPPSAPHFNQPLSPQSSRRPESQIHLPSPTSSQIPKDPDKYIPVWIISPNIKELWLGPRPNGLIPPSLLFLRCFYNYFRSIEAQRDTGHPPWTKESNG